MEKELEIITADLMSLSADDPDSPPSVARGIEDTLDLDSYDGGEIEQLYRALDKVADALKNDELDMDASGLDTIGRGTVLPFIKEVAAAEIPIPPKPRPKRKSKSALKLRLDLNLDVVVELKAKIRGDITLSLL
ncbi:hypothetical protein MPER_11156 [Moniliophthora perniciosa FA553]|nr:hypothetical protein MPER_11156 [Moniliophthora perniciosa FA553]